MKKRMTLIAVVSAVVLTGAAVAAQMAAKKEEPGRTGHVVTRQEAIARAEKRVSELKSMSDAEFNKKRDERIAKMKQRQAERRKRNAAAPASPAQPIAPAAPAAGTR